MEGRGRGGGGGRRRGGGGGLVALVVGEGVRMGLVLVVLVLVLLVLLVGGREDFTTDGVDFFSLEPTGGGVFWKATEGERKRRGRKEVGEGKS